MRRWTATFLKLIWGIYLVLTSIYCLLAFLPYTYFALIKAPAYSWMPWFAHLLSALAVAMPTLIGGGDWNGVQQNTFTILFWIALSLCVYTLRPRRKSYSAATIARGCALDFEGRASNPSLLAESKAHRKVAKEKQQVTQNRTSHYPGFLWDLCLLCG